MCPLRIVRQMPACGLLLLAFALPVHAQGPTTSDSRVFFGVGAGVSSSAPAFAERWRTPLHAEEALFETRYGGFGRSGFEVSGGARVWRNVWVGVAYGQANGRGSAEIAASLPHPFRFDEPRTIQGRVEGFERRERIVHLDVMLRHPLTRRLQVVAFAGPAHLSVSQGVIGNIGYTDEYPYDSATFTGAAPSTSSVSKTTVGVGGGLTAALHRVVSVSVLVRHASANVRFEPTGTRRIDASVGGTRAVIGALLEF